MSSRRASSTKAKNRVPSNNATQEDNNGPTNINYDLKFAMMESNMSKLMDMFQSMMERKEEDKETPNKSTSRSATVVPISTSTQVQSAASLSLPAAIESKVKLPEPPKLTGRIIQPEAFTEWKMKIKDIIEAYPRYRPLLLLKPEDGWTEFKRLNSKFTSVELEEHYLDAQRSLWSFITSCFDSNVVLHISDEMQSERSKHHLPSILHFHVDRDSTFYKNCYSLMEKLAERFQMKSGWRVSNLMKQLTFLQYQYGTDPSIFIQEYHSIQRQLKTLVPDYPIFPDKVQAYEILTKLPKELDHLKTQFLNPDQPPTVDQVQGSLLNWWQAEKANKGNHRSSRQSTPSTTKQSANPAVTPKTNRSQRNN
jgi:hypothetical protein